MPAENEPITYTTPPFAAVSGVVKHDTSQMTATTPLSEPGPSRPALRGPFWAFFAFGIVVAIMVGMSIAWWRQHKRRLARDYYNELVPLSNYQEWRDRQADRLLRPTTNSSASPSRRDSESQRSGGHSPSASPTSSKES